MTRKPATQAGIPLHLIDPNPEQPRQNFDQARLEELAQSIREVGLIQPITVEISANGERYVIHDGERRWRAAQLAGLEEIPAYVVGHQADGQELLTHALVANVQREDLNPLEIACGFAKLKELGLTDQQIADRVGKSRSTVTNARRLLELPEEAQALVDQGVSERALMALLPMYKLPEAVLHIGDDDDGYGGFPWNSPRSLLAELAKEGSTVTSEYVRRHVDQIITAHTQDLERAAWPLDHAFDADGLQVRSPRCDDCPARLKHDGEWRCGEAACFDAKKLRWSADTLAAASEACGIPPLVDEPAYTHVERFYTDGDLLDGIMAEGCDKLRLMYTPYATGGAGQLAQLADHDHVTVVCHHGRGKHCTCLSRKRAEKTKTDPLHIAQKEREKELQRLVDQYAQALDAALAEEHPKAWLMVLRSMSYQCYQYSKRGDDWDFAQIRQALARELMRNRVSWRAKENMEVARTELNNYFDALGLPSPDGAEPAADLRRRFDRIQGWIADLDRDQVTIEQVTGNLANLEKITEEFDAIADQHIDDERFEGFLQDLADAWEALDAIKSQLEQQARRVGAPTFEED